MLIEFSLFIFTWVLLIWESLFHFLVKSKKKKTTITLVKLLTLAFSQVVLLINYSFNDSEAA